VKVERDTWDMAGICTDLYVWVYPYTHTHTPEVVDVTREDRKVAIYATPGFKATWKKYLEICDRDGLSASREIRIFVEGEVARRAPGNPQRPLEAFVPGHPDAVQAVWSTMLKELLARAEHLGGDLSYTEVLEVFKAQGVEGSRLPVRAQSMARGLEKLGVRVWY